MKKVGDYYKIDKSDIVLKGNTKIISYYVECFDRSLVLLLNNPYLDFMDVIEVGKQLDKNYLKWHDKGIEECCEEYMINNLETQYKRSIVAVIYEGGDDKDE